MGLKDRAGFDPFSEDTVVSLFFFRVHEIRPIMRVCLKRMDLPSEPSIDTL